MDIALGIYSQQPFGAPDKAFEGSIQNIVLPLLQRVYRTPGLEVSVCVSAAGSEWVSALHPEVHMLAVELIRQKRLELCTSVYTSTPLSTLLARERSAAIESTTTLISRTSHVKARTYMPFCGMWNTSNLAVLNNLNIENVVVPGDKSLTGAAESSFVMDDITGRIVVRQGLEKFDKILKDYCSGQSDYATSVKALQGLVKENATRDAFDPLVVLIDADSLSFLSLKNKSKTDPAKLIDEFMSLVPPDTHWHTFSLLPSPKENGYLPSGWYSPWEKEKTGPNFHRGIYTNPFLTTALQKRQYLESLLVTYNKKYALATKKQIETPLVRSSSFAGAQDRYLSASYLQDQSEAFYDCLFHFVAPLSELPEIPLGGTPTRILIGPSIGAITSPKGGAICDFCDLYTFWDYAPCGLFPSDTITFGSTPSGASRLTVRQNDPSKVLQTSPLVFREGQRDATSVTYLSPELPQNIALIRTFTISKDSLTITTTIQNQGGVREFTLCESFPLIVSLQSVGGELALPEPTTTDSTTTFTLVNPRRASTLAFSCPTPFQVATQSELSIVNPCDQVANVKVDLTWKIRLRKNEKIDISVSLSPGKESTHGNRK